MYRRKRYERPTTVILVEMIFKLKEGLARMVEICAPMLYYKEGEI